jgi:hypothetical protein
MRPNFACQPSRELASLLLCSRWLMLKFKQHQMMAITPLLLAPVSGRNGFLSLLYCGLRLQKHCGMLWRCFVQTSVFDVKNLQVLRFVSVLELI